MRRFIPGLLLVFLLFLSGCRIGIGVGVEIRLGEVVFRSQDAALSGSLFLDGREVGYLPPSGELRCLVALDFPHEVKVFAPACPEGGCVFRIVPPLRPGEVIILTLPR